MRPTTDDCSSDAKARWGCGPRHLLFHQSRQPGEAGLIGCRPTGNARHFDRTIGACAARARVSAKILLRRLRRIGIF
jgi:hypothetical protein